MDQEPVVIKMNVPGAHGPFRKLLDWKFLKSLSGQRSTTLITAGAAVVISISTVGVVAFTVLANNASFQQKHNLNTLPKPPTAAQKSAAALPGGGTATGIGSCTGTNCPAVTLNATPGTVNINGSSKLNWSVANNPKNCTASDDWSGSKPNSGYESTGPLTKLQTYLYTLTCTNTTGTGFSTVPVGVASQSGGTGSVALRPSVTLAAYPTSVYTGQTTQLKWEATNNPSSCTASGTWSGVKPASGSETTVPLTNAQNYVFSIQCSNSAGTSPLVSISVSATAPPVGFPVITLFSAPVGTAKPNSSVTLTWSTTNNPTSCTAGGDWSGSKPASGTYSTGALSTIKSYTYSLTCVNSTGSLTSTVNVNVVPDPPAVSLTVSPNPQTVGNSSTIAWNVANNTSGTTCTASGAWPGSLNITPTASGTRSTGVFNAAGTYTYSLVCKNEGGTSASVTASLTVGLPPPPIVSLSVSPISISTGGSATITWSALNNPTSCATSGSLTGTLSPLSGGSKSTGTMSTAGSYTYGLSCSNAGGTSSTVSATLTVGGSSASSPPVVTVSISPTSISTGSSATVSWSATNSPTSCSAGGTSSNWVNSPGASGTASTGVISSAGNRTYSITCTNSVGSGSGSASLSVVALPTVSVSLASSSITAGGSTTYSWSSTGASSCSGGGVLSGSKATSGGPVTTGIMSTAGTYNYTISCVNSLSGSASATAVLTVNNPVQIYCSGNTPCYGPNDLAGHTSSSSCWAYNLGRVVDVTNLNNGYHKNGPGNLLPSGFTSICGNVDLQPYLQGSASIPSLGSHRHGNAASNVGTITSYFVGYYDATKP